MFISKSGLSKLITPLTLIALLFSIMPATTAAVRVTVDHDIHLHINEKTVNKLTHGALHVSQLSGAALFAWLLYKETVSQQNTTSLKYTIPLLALSMPAIYTLADTGYNGLKDMLTKKKTVPETIQSLPENIKAKIKKTVRDW